MTDNQAPPFEDLEESGAIYSLWFDDPGTMEDTPPNANLGDGAMGGTPPAEKPPLTPAASTSRLNPAASLAAIKTDAVKDVSTLLGGKTPLVKDSPRTIDEAMDIGRTGAMNLPWEAAPSSPIPKERTNQDPTLGALGGWPNTPAAFPGLDESYGVVEDRAFYTAPDNLKEGDPLLYGILGNYNQDAKKKREEYARVSKQYDDEKSDFWLPPKLWFGSKQKTSDYYDGKFNQVAPDRPRKPNQERAQQLMAIPPSLRSTGRLFKLWDQSERRQGREGAAGIKTMERYYNVVDDLSQKHFQKPISYFFKDRVTPKDEAQAKTLNRFLHPSPEFKLDPGALTPEAEEKPALSEDLKGYEDYLPGGDYANGGIKNAIKAKYPDAVWGKMTSDEQNQAIKGLVDEKKASAEGANLTERLREGRTAGPDAVRMAREYKDSILPEVFKASKLGGGAGPAAAAEHSRKLRQYGALAKKYSPELATQYMTDPAALKKSDPEAFAAAQKLVGPVKGAGVSSDSTGGVSNTLDSIQDKIASGKGHNNLRELGSSVQQLQQLMGEKGISDFSSLPRSLQKTAARVISKAQALASSTSPRNVSTFLQKELNPLIKRIGGTAVNNRKNLNNATSQRAARTKAAKDREDVRSAREKARLERQKFLLNRGKVVNEDRRAEKAQDFYQKHQTALFQWNARRGLEKDNLSREQMQARHADQVAKSKRNNSKILANNREAIASSFQKMITNQKAMDLLSTPGNVVNTGLSEYYSKYVQYPDGMQRLIKNLPANATAADRAVILTYILGEAASTPLTQSKRRPRKKTR